MNPLFPIITAGAMYIQPIVPQTYYVANLSETDGAKCGEYIAVSPQIVPQIPAHRITPLVIEPEANEGD